MCSFALRAVAGVLIVVAVGEGTYSTNIQGGSMSGRSGCCWPCVLSGPVRRRWSDTCSGCRGSSRGAFGCPICMGQAPLGSARVCFMAVIFHQLQIWCAIPHVGGPLDGAAPQQNAVNEIAHHILEGRVGLEFFGARSTNRPLCKSVRVLHQAVCNQNVDCHHHNGADDVEGVRKEVVDPGVFINGF